MGGLRFEAKLAVEAVAPQRAGQVQREHFIVILSLTNIQVLWFNLRGGLAFQPVHHLSDSPVGLSEAS